MLLQTNMRAILPVIAILIVQARSDIVELDESSLEDVFEGEWMVLFYAPWCPACQRIKPQWSDFGTWSKDLDFRIAQCDVTKSPGLSGQFMILGLPSIFHVKDGITRQYTGSRESPDLIAFIDEKKWTNLEPVTWWMAPNTIQMRAVGLFFRFANFVRSLHVKMTDEYNIPSLGAYAVFAVITILLGLALGFALVLLLDCACPQKPAQRANTPPALLTSARRALSQPADKGAPVSTQSAAAANRKQKAAASSQPKAVGVIPGAAGEVPAAAKAGRVAADEGSDDDDGRIEKEGVTRSDEEDEREPLEGSGGEGDGAEECDEAADAGKAASVDEEKTKGTNGEEATEDGGAVGATSEGTGDSVERETDGSGGGESGVESGATASVRRRRKPNKI